MLSIYETKSKDGGNMRRKRSIICILAILIVGGVIAIISNSVDSKTKRLKEKTTTSEQSLENKKNLSDDIISEIELNKDTDDDNEFNENNKVENSSKKTQGTKIFGELVEKPIIENGKKVGTYAEAKINNKVKLSDEDIIEFYEDTVKDSNYEWVTLRISKDKGVQFNNGSHIFNYGTLNDDGQVTDVLGSGNVMLDKIEYQGK